MTLQSLGCICVSVQRMLFKETSIILVEKQKIATTPISTELMLMGLGGMSDMGMVTRIKTGIGGYKQRLLWAKYICINFRAKRML